MKKIVHRRLEWSIDELQGALLEWLMNKDQPRPNGNEKDFEFKITNEGKIIIAWTEVWNG